MKNKFFSPMRYPGGKVKLTPFIKQIFYENNLVGCDYVEPYAGGAAVALSLLFGEYVKNISINDYDRGIYAFWHSVVNHNDDFCEKILQTPVTIEVWQKQKNVQEHKRSSNLFSLGFSTFFLNRTNVSGIIKGGVIGGLDQKGKYKMDARFNKASLIKRIQFISKYKDRINVSNYDALEILKSDLGNNFIYLDPPYVKKAKNLYMNFYNKNNHCEISKLLLCGKTSFYWMLSYDKNELIDILYKSCKKKLSWCVKYGTSSGKGEEYIFVCKKLKTTKSEAFFT